MLFERRLDFSWFDPVAAQFDLVVLATQKLQRRRRFATARGHRCDTAGSYRRPAGRSSTNRSRVSSVAPVVALRQVLRRRGTALRRCPLAAAAAGRRGRRRAAFGMGRPIGTVVALPSSVRARMNRCPHRDLGRPVLVEERRPLEGARSGARRAGADTIRRRR